MLDGCVGYICNGSFLWSVDGMMTMVSGYVVQLEIWIFVDAIEVNILQDGLVTVCQVGEEEVQEVGQLIIVFFVNLCGLQFIGESFVI